MTTIKIFVITTDKYLQTQCTPVTEEQCATLPSVVCEEVPDQVIHDTAL